MIRKYRHFPKNGYVRGIEADECNKHRTKTKLHNDCVCNFVSFPCESQDRDVCKWQSLAEKNSLLPNKCICIVNNDLPACRTGCEKVAAICLICVTHNAQLLG